MVYIQNLVPFCGQFYELLFPCHLSTSVRSGEAINIDEYVPKNIPAANVKEKIRVDSGPHKTKQTRTIIVERDVFSERKTV